MKNLIINGQNHKGNTEMAFRESNGEDADFVFLCKKLDEALNEFMGEKVQRSVYGQYNLLADIHDSIIVYDHNVPVACGSFKKYDALNAELKRIYVAPEYRLCGLGAQLVGMLEAKAREQDYRFCILETGVPLKAALHLYQKLGYVVIPNYGQYANMQDSICMRKELL